jgi:hypothetical protein
LPALIDSTSTAGIERIAQAVAHEIDGQDRNR